MNDMMRTFLSTTLTAPVVLPLLGGALGAVFTQRPMLRRTICVTALTLTLLYAILLARTVFTTGPILSYVGNWRAPFGITFVADGLSALMLLMSCGVGLAVMIYSFGDSSRTVEHFSFHPLMLIQIMGVNGAFLVGDIFNLYVWFEVLLTASFALLCIGSTRRQLQAGIPYLVLNLMSSTMFLIGCGMVYGVAGTLNIAQIAQRFGQLAAPGITTALAALFLLGYCIKAGIFPLFGWLPISYYTPPVAVTALFSALMTKVGIYAMLRLFPLIFPDDLLVFQPLILVAAGLTMVIGALGALAQNNIRRLLAFDLASQSGYLLMGIALGTREAAAATAFYMVHIAITKSTLFLICGVAERDFATQDIRRMGGLVRSRPWLALLFGISALSLAGIPPLSGFLAKLSLVEAVFGTGHYLSGGVALAVSLLTMLAMTRLWSEVFWKAEPHPTRLTHRDGDETDDGHEHDETAHPVHRPGDLFPALKPLIVAPIVALVVCIIGLGLFGGPVMTAAQQAGEEITNVSAYIQFVLGDSAAGASE